MKHRHFNSRGLSISGKLILSLSAIGMTMVLTIVISAIEFKRMSNYVSEDIDEDIKCVNVSQKIASGAERYNLEILAAVGSADSLSTVTNFDQTAELQACRELILELDSVQPMPLTDSLRNVYTEYLDASQYLGRVIESNFIDTRDWFFKFLQPRYNALTEVLDGYNADVHNDLMDKAEHFQTGFYRSIIPLIVAVGAGLLLLCLLLFFLLAFYVKPIYRMLDSLDNYNSRGKKYVFTFDGDDQLAKLNDEIIEIVDENVELKRRVKYLKEDRKEDQQ